MSLISFAWFLCRRKDSRVDVSEMFCLVFVQEEGFGVDEPDRFCLVLVQEEGFKGRCD